MRVFATSDLHLDYRQNQQWLMQLSTCDFNDDVLILAGDISHKIELLELCFSQLKKRFKQVLYVPGNHDLWINKQPYDCSLAKFRDVLYRANQNGLMTEPWHQGQLTIVPLFSWYDFSFGPACDYLQQRWMDFFSCSWQAGFEQLGALEGREQAITRHFLQLNEGHLQQDNDVLISFSHFLPRIDLMPGFIPELHRKLYPVLGSEEIEQQVRRLGAQIHVYGHSHVNRDIELDGIRYVNNAFGGPSEERISRKQLYCIYDSELL